MKSAKHNRILANGVNGATGGYLLPPLSVRDVSAVVRKESPPEDSQLRELRWWHEYTTYVQMGPMEGVDPKDLAEAGWGVIFASDTSPAIRKALKPLLKHRRKQARRLNPKLYRKFVHRPGESKLEFLARHGVGPGPVDPRRVPYYLLIVGGPRAIPFHFQYQLDLQYAVGRIEFDTPEEYAQYAESVVKVETDDDIDRSRRITFFGVKNPDDLATQLSYDHLIRPLARSMSKALADWKVEKVKAKKATKARLLGLLGGRQTPALLFTASHGVGFPKGHPHQMARQGALLCRDWPGPIAGRKRVGPDVYLAGEDIAKDARLLGLIAFHFACYGAGTPALDYFAKRAFRKPAKIAPSDFTAYLPRRLLGHPGGGALAVVSHVERAWSYSFRWPRAGKQLQMYEGLLRRLVDGHPIGSAMEFFNQRYAELATALTDELEYVDSGRKPDHGTLARLWTATNDARSFLVLGDPAVRLPGA